MPKPTRFGLSLLCGCCLLFVAGVAWAEDKEVKEAPIAGDAAAGKEGGPPTANAAAAPRVLKAVVRGFYIEASGGGGYMLLKQPVAQIEPYTGATGDEALGWGGLVQLNAGYDLTDMIAIQATAGGQYTAGERRDVSRDLGMLYGGAGVRVALDITDRLDFVAVASALVMSADNAVEPAKIGFGVLANVGVEYYVHVRHFSIGINAAVLFPVMPVRLFVALTPTLKYTF